MSKRRRSDKPIEAMSMEELSRAVEGYTFLQDNFLRLHGELLRDWPDLSDSARLDRVRKLAGPWLINPMPLDDVTHEASGRHWAWLLAWGKVAIQGELRIWRLTVGFTIWKSYAPKDSA